MRSAPGITPDESVTSTRGAIPAATGVHAPLAIPEARPERPTRSASAGLCMDVTGPVSSKQRQGTADRVGEVY